MVLPEQFTERMRVLLGDDFDRFMSAYDLPLRRGVRVNTEKITAKALCDLFAAPLHRSPFAEDSFYLDAAHRAGADPLFHAGAYYMQEPSAASAVTVLASKPGERILDLCAAPGGKSTQIAAMLQGQGLLWSNEYVKSRARILEQNIERCGVRGAVVSNAAAGQLAERLSGFFDGVLVDAPCSGEGMFRKEPDALTGWSEQNIRMCAERQREILSAAADTVRPGGRLVYSTCTFAPEENECTVAWLLRARPDLEPVDITVGFGCEGFAFERVAPFDKTVEKGRFSEKATRRIFPYHGGEGHFIAAFRRREDALSAVPAMYAYPPADAAAKEAEKLYADCFADALYGVPVTVGQAVRLLPRDLPDLKGCGVLSAGVALAEIKKGRLEPCHAAFMAAQADACRRLVSLPLQDPLVRAFLHGEEIPCDGENGFTAVAVEGVICGFGKVSGGRLKNRYPKGLRLL